MDVGSKLTFAVDPKTGGIEWYVPKDAPDTTTDQALVIAVVGLGKEMSSIASALMAIAEAIRERPE